MELIGVFHGIWDLSINKKLYDFIIFLTHTKLQLILWTGNSAALLPQDFYSECWFLTLNLVTWPLSERKIEPVLVKNRMAFCQTLANKKNKFLVKLFVGMGAFQINKELFKSSCPVKKKPPSQMRREEARKTNIALTNLTKFLWKNLRIKSLLIIQKLWK